MRSDTTWRWIYGGAVVVFLAAGLFHLLHGSVLGLAAILSAVLIAAGLLWGSAGRPVIAGAGWREPAAHSRALPGCLP